MAKVEFERTKPHVNVAAALMQLQRAGFSSQGARQIVFGEVITDPEDRALVTKLLTESATSSRGTS